MTLTLLRGLPRRVWVLGGIVSLSLMLCGLSLALGWVDRQTLHTWVIDAGPLGMLSYVGLLVLLNLLWMPRMWGLLAGGMLFGPWWGGFLSLGGDLIAAGICFWIARSTGQGWAAQVIGNHPQARRIQQLLAVRQAVVTVAFLRICPVFHYTLASYSAGLAGVEPRAFFLGTFLGIIPGAILYPMLGDAALGPPGPLLYATAGLIALFLIATLLIAKRALARPRAINKRSSRRC